MRFIKIKTSSWLFKIIVALYLMTWMFGVPVVQTLRAQEAIDGYHWLQRTHHTIGPTHPSVHFHFCACPLPFVVLTNAESRSGPLYGHGGWALYFWSPMKTVKLIEMTTWVS